MHLQSQSSVPGFSWQDDSSRLASPFPLGSKCLGLRSQRLPQSHQRVRGWWCSWPGLGSVHGPSQALSSTAAEVLTRYIPHSLLMLSACRSVFRFASSMQSKPAWCRPWHRHYRFTLHGRSFFFFPIISVFIPVLDPLEASLGWTLPLPPSFALQHSSHPVFCPFAFRSTPTLCYPV
jgi:hypothetical protein